MMGSRIAAYAAFALLCMGSARAWNVPLSPAVSLTSTSAYRVASGRSVADMDRDGDADVVVKKQLTSPTVYALLWLKNTNAATGNWPEVSISSGVDENPLAVADLNHDGTADVLTFRQQPDKAIQWYANSSSGTVWTLHESFTNFALGTLADAAELADLDRDGYPDLILSVANTNQPLYWFANNQAGTWTRHDLGPIANSQFTIGDLDRDGFVDVVRHDFNQLLWLENRTDAGILSNWTSHVIATNRSGETRPVVLDADQDGDPDVFVSSSPIGWYENIAGGTGWVFHAQGTASFAGLPVDLDRDGDEDMAAEDFWYENPGRAGGAWTKRSFTNLLGSATDIAGLGDADEDGDLDLFVRSVSNQLHLVRVESPSLNFAYGGERTVATNLPNASDVEAADLDRDGDLDLVAASYINGVLWYQNNGSATSWTARVIQTNGTDYSALAVTDLDADGDPDVAAAQYSGGNIVWFRNLDGAGGSWQISTVAVAMVSTFDLDAERINADDYTDLAGTAGFSEQVVSWLNRDGAATNWLHKLVAGSLPGCYGLAFGDLDRDGDPDLVATELSGTHLRWFRNPLNNPGTNWLERIITTNGPGYADAALADVDGDGDLDVAAVSVNADRLDLWINTDGLGTAWSNVVSSSTFTDPVRIVAGDMNLDGMPDLLTSELGDDRVSVFFNTGSPTVWFRRNLATSFTGTYCVAAADLDDDGDPDVITTEGNATRLVWFPKEGTVDLVLNKTVDRAAAQFGGPVAFTLVVTNAGPEPASGVVVTDTLPPEIEWTSDTAGAGPPVGSNLTWSIGALAIGQAATCVIHCTVAVMTNEVTVTNVARASADVPLADSGHALASAAVRLADLYGTIASNLDGVCDTAIADFDGDGWLDVIAAVSNAGDIVARRSVQATNWQVYTASSSGSLTNPTRIAVADFDRDGSIDVAAISRTAGRIAWWDHFNVGASGGLELGIATGYVGLASIEAADMDRDGDADLLVAVTDSSTVLWFENRGGLSTNWPAHSVGTAAGVTAATAVDLDRDGDPDVAVVTSGGLTRRIMNVGGSGTNWTGALIGGGLSGASCILAADVDGDGDQDLMAGSSSSGAIALWENFDGAGGSWTQRIDYLFLAGVSDLAATDWDGDGDQDVLASGRFADSVVWCENVDRRGQHWSAHVLRTGVDGANSVSIGDLNRDGSPDFATAASDSDRLLWSPGAPRAWPGTIADAVRVVLTNGWNEVGPIALFDADGDGDLDLAASSRSNRTIRLWRNLDRAGTRWSFTNLTTTLNYIGGLRHGDLDGDGDEDLVSLPDLGNESVWMWENADGRGETWTPRRICESAVVYNALDSVLCDLDRDGDLDLVVQGYVNTTNRPLFWFANQGGGSWSTNQLAVATTNAETVAAGDLDRDGDPDLVVGGSAAYLLENTGGASGWTFRVVTTVSSPLTCVAISDLDRNGTNDVLYTSLSSVRLLRFGTPFTNTTDVLLGTARNSSVGLEVIDFDRDGDFDVVAASDSYTASTGKVTVLENVTTSATLAFLDGIQAGFDTYSARSVEVGDIDGDGDPDVAAGFYVTAFYGVAPTLAWWPNRSTNSLAIDKSVSPVSLGAGTTVTWTVTVSNSLPVAASVVTVTDWLPPETLWLSDSCGVGHPGTNAWTWTVGTLAPGATASCTITALFVAATAELVNHARVAGTASGFAGLTELDTAVASGTADDFDHDGLVDGIDPDDDNDGMTDVWETQYGLNPRNAADAGTDGDADGFDNLAEFIALTSPTNGGDFFRVSGLGVAGGVTLTYGPSATGRLYTLEYTVNLAGTGWTQAVGQIDVPGGSGTLTNVVTTGRFHRVRVRMP